LKILENHKQKNCDVVVYHKGLFLAGNATRESKFSVGVQIQYFSRKITHCGMSSEVSMQALEADVLDTFNRFDQLAKAMDHLLVEVAQELQSVAAPIPPLDSSHAV